jgi:hypothetical protein
MESWILMFFVSEISSPDLLDPALLSALNWLVHDFLMPKLDFIVNDEIEKYLPIKGVRSKNTCR